MTQRRDGDPTEEEIAKRCRKVREGWTIAQERKARTGSRHQKYLTVQEVRIATTAIDGKR